MKIDIIDLSDPEYKDLSPVQLAMVRAAQLKKNHADDEFEVQKKEYTFIFANHNLVATSELETHLKTIESNRDKEVEAIREDLQYQLAYEALGTEGNANGPYRYPQNPNYSLTPSQRFLVVRNYYMETVDDPAARYEALRGDNLARSYLGDFYATLLDMFASYM